MSSWSIIKSNEIDVQKWDEVVGQSTNEHIYCYFNYLNALSVQWVGCIEGDYDALIPLRVNQKYGLRYVGQFPHIQRVSISCKKGFKADFDGLKSILGTSFSYVDFTADVELNSVKWTQKPRANFILPLSSELAEIECNYNSNLKRNIKKALKNNLRSVELETSRLTDAIEVFKENTNHNLPKEWYSQLLNLSESQDSRLFAAAKGKAPMAYALVLKSRTRLVLLFTALTSSGRNEGAMPFLIASIISEYAGQDLVFDFEGSENENLARFYKSFGSFSETYFHYESKGTLKKIKDLVKSK